VKRVLFGIIVGLAVGAAAVWILLKHSGTEGGQEATKEEKKAEAFVHHGTNGETFLKLDAEAQALMGLKTAPLAAAQSKPEVKGYGRVLDPAPLAALLVEGASAKAALEASTREFERLKGLHADNQNASLRAVEAAEAAMKRDQIALDSVSPRLLLGWGKAIASQPNLPAFAGSLVAQETALARVDLPLSQSLRTPPTGGRLAALTAPESFAEAQYLGPAPSADPQMQAQGFLFLLDSNPLPPGAGVVAWLSIPGAEQFGVMVPRAALLRHEGGVFVYLQIGDDTFQRKEVKLERPATDGWFVAEGLKPRDKVVVVGAQQLLSEELKGQGGE
jgi:hypothetical protein